ncbi:RING-H2 finger protein ATL11 [Carex littledalei]|uniref:RING-H2 finger protein ATL11 n=1 Tax=Carex littledalei TaxID=544730 RepID=A0A833VKX0_9POAL|nr:RING-H2 finger protein ATL11 [Carex littledalei]
MVDLNNSQDSESAPISVDGQSSFLALLLTVSCPLIVLIFIFLFFKLFCRIQTIVLPNETSNYLRDRTMQKNQHDGIDAQNIQGTSIELFQEETGSDADAQCSICLGGLVDGDKVKVLPKCCHVFHQECIDMWLGSHSSCPLCRASLVARPVVEPSMVV